MPLKSGSSSKVVSTNIRELETKTGKRRTHKQNIAIALSKAREGKR